MYFKLERSRLQFLKLGSYSILLEFSSLDLKSFVVLDNMLTSLILKYFILLESVYKKKSTLLFGLYCVRIVLSSADPNFFPVGKRTVYKLGLSPFLFLLLLTS